MKSREIEGDEGIRWACVQAYAGLADQGAAEAAAQVGETDLFRVICTPSGGNPSIELHLPAGWEDDLSDEALLKEIRSHGR